ncbi:MAG: hypothetical protein ACRDRV_17565 [Pseudonocardiaceae bacterium]
MDSDPHSRPGPAPPWAHRSWCAPECTFRSGAVEGTHLGRAWTMTPADGETGQLELRLVEQLNEGESGLVRVLLSITERRLTDDLDPLAEIRKTPGPAMPSGLADITSSAELTADQAGRVFEQLVAFARLARQAEGGDCGTSTT